jgi:hypothetical protein
MAEINTQPTDAQTIEMNRLLSFLINSFAILCVTYLKNLTQ